MKTIGLEPLEIVRISELKNPLTFAGTLPLPRRSAGIRRKFRGIFVHD